MGVSGLVVAGAFGAGALTLTAASIPFIIPALRKVCIPYVPATDSQLRNVVKVLKKSSAFSPIVDLGSGDGRVVLQCAASGHPSVGLELNPILVMYSKYKARRMGHSHLARFYRKDIFKEDLGMYNTAIIFGAEMMMKDILMKVDEMKIGSYLIACRFPLPDNEAWKLITVVGEGVDTVWLYIKYSFINVSSNCRNGTIGKHKGI